MTQKTYQMKKRNLNPVTFLYVLGVLCGLYTSYGYAQATEKQIKIAVSTAPVTLDPRFATDASSARLLRLLTYSLVKYENGVAQPSEISEKIWSDDARIYNVKLKKSAIFSDGSKLTADVVKAYFENIRSAESNSPLKGSVKDISSIEVKGDILIFKLNKPNVWFWSVLKDILITKLPNDSSRIENPVGLSKVYFRNKNALGDVTLYDARTNKEFVYKVVKDPVVKLLKLMNNEVDVVYNDIPVELYQHGIKNGLKGVSIPAASYTYMGFNLEDEVSGKDKVRQAIDLAIDKKKIIKTLLQNHAQEAHSILLPSHLNYVENKQEYNPKQAIQLLEEAGYAANENNERLFLRLSITTNPFIMRVAQIIQSQLAEIGIAVDISSSEWGTFYGNIKKSNFQSYILSWVGDFQPNFYEYIFSSSMIPPNGANRGRLINPKMDRLIETIMQEEDLNKQRDAVIKIQELQNELMVYVPLWRKNHLLLSQSNVSGCEITANGGYEGLLHCDVD